MGDIRTTEERPVGLRVRPDLTFSRQSQQGRNWWVVKDPLSLRYFRLREEQYAALVMLEKDASVSSIQTRLEAEFPLVTFSPGQLQSLFLMFHRSGLVLSDSPEQSVPLLKRHVEKRQKAVASKFLSILCIKLPGVDPDRFLTWASPKLGWIFHPFSVFCSFTLMLFAMILVAVNFEQFQAKLFEHEQFFVAKNLPWLMAGLAISKILHELGHAFACKHFGGECHRIGLMLLVFTPCLYCDTSDSWMLRSKWKRAAIGAAGMYVELTLAAICTFVWWNTQPGLLHYLSLSIMTISSISTLLFNSNPLLRYDGYYILSDLIEVPNLSTKANAALQGIVESWFFTTRDKLGQALPEYHRNLFAAYALASPVYRWLVVVAILWFLAEFFEPLGLKSLGYLLISMSLVGMIVMPIWHLIHYFRAPGRMQNIKLPRLIGTFAFLFLLASGIALVPIPHRIVVPVVIQKHDAESVYVTIPGTIQNISKKPGDRVEAGETIAQLSNDEIEFEITRLRGQEERLETEINNLQRQQAYDTTAVQNIPATKQSLAGIQERLSELELERARLKLIAPRGGTVHPAMEIPRPSLTGKELATFFGGPFEERNREVWLPVGTTFCTVGDPQRLSAVLIIDQSEIDFVRHGQLVELNLDEYPTRVWSGRVARTAINRMESAPREASLRLGGELQTKSDANGNERPAHASYEVRVPFEENTVSILAGFRGRAKVNVGRLTLARILWKNFVTVFHFG